MLVADILRNKGRDIVTASAEDTLLDVAEQLATRRIGALVVKDGSDRMIGIVSERDIVRMLALEGPDVVGRPVSDVMSRKVVTCTESDTIDSLLERMTAGKFRHFPVMEGERLIGIVSIGDIVKHRIEETEREARAMRDYIATA